MGLPGCDVDDGLALLFTLGFAAKHGNCRIEGICTSYGNSTQKSVFENTRRICRSFGLDVPIVRGAASKESPDCEAVRYLVDMARAYPGELSLAVTGSTTNLKGALSIDPDVLQKYREVVFMGGISEPITFGGKRMGELNLSCDPEATKAAFSSAGKGACLSVMTANNCLPAFFESNEFLEKIPAHEKSEAGLSVATACAAWFDTMHERYGLSGFHCWDVLVPAFILAPELFECEKSVIALEGNHFESGLLKAASPTEPHAVINTPCIKDSRTFIEYVYQCWDAGLDAFV